MLDCKSMLKNISKGQSSIPLKYLIAGLENDFQSLRNSIRLMYLKYTDNIVTIYYKAPSSSIPGLTYDVVFEFYGDKLSRITTDTKFKVYCNSPSFYFRYGNIFKAFGSLLWIDKYPSQIKDSADVRNPSQVTGFDKYIYSCLRLSMLQSIDELKSQQYLDRPPKISTFNEKRFEYIKAKKLAKIDFE